MSDEIASLISRSFAESELFQTCLKETNSTTKRERFRFTFQATNLMVASLQRRLNADHIPCRAECVPYVAASPIGLRWTLYIQPDDTTRSATLVTDGALRELVYSRETSFTRTLDVAAYTSEQTLTAKAEAIAKDWASWVTSKLSTLASDQGLVQDYRDRWFFPAHDTHRRDFERDLDMFVVDHPINCQPGSAILLQYEATMMNLFRKHRRELKLLSVLPVPLQHAMFQEDDAALPSDEDDEEKIADTSILELVEENHGADTEHAIFLYLGVSRLNPVANPFALLKLNEQLLALNCHFLPIYKSAADLCSLWQRGNLIHSSLTSLSHHGATNSFQIKWHNNISLGVTDYSNYVRNFREGTRYPNLRMSGLADFEHICRVRRNSDGYEAFSKSIAELIICASLSCMSEMTRKHAGLIVGVTLAEALARHKGDYEGFWKQAKGEELWAVVDDISTAKLNDQLNMCRVVRLAELFVLSLER
ncbi:MAG: hypothetical protein WA126_02165 [Thermodesulfovibrionales bacterium]